MNSVHGNGVAHDALEHDALGLAAEEDELCALGASLYLRPGFRHRGMAQVLTTDDIVSGFVESLKERGAMVSPCPDFPHDVPPDVAARIRACAAARNPRYGVEYSSPLGLGDSNLRSWLAYGFLQARERFGGWPGGGYGIFETTAARAEKLRWEGVGGDRLRVLVDWERHEIKLWLSGSEPALDYSWRD